MMRSFKKCWFLVMLGLMLSGCGKSSEAGAIVQKNDYSDVTNTASLKGKILVSSIQQDADVMTFKIFAINPKNSNECSLVRVFVVPNRESAVFYNAEAYPSVNKFFDFTADYTKLAATREIAGNAHAGWVDGAGNFTDVTAEMAGDFFAFGFTNAGRFVFHDAADQFFSVNVAALDDLCAYKYNVEDFVPRNQAFVDMRMGDDFICWSNFASPDGRRMVFCAMRKDDAEARQLYIAPTIGAEPAIWCDMPATNSILKLAETEKYGVVYGDAVLDWR